MPSKREERPTVEQLLTRLAEQWTKAIRSVRSIDQTVQQLEDQGIGRREMLTWFKEKGVYANGLMNLTEWLRRARRLVIDAIDHLLSLRGEEGEPAGVDVLHLLVGGGQADCGGVEGPSGTAG